MDRASQGQFVKGIAPWNKGESKLPLDELHDLYWEEGLTLEEIAEKYSCDPTLIIHWMEKLGIRRRERVTEKFLEEGKKTRFKQGHTPWNKGLHKYLGGKRFQKGQIPWNKGKPMSDEHLRNWFKSVEAKPNKAELRLLEILQGEDPAWRYVGDGALIIDGKCPDFYDGDHGLMELFGDYWHRGEDPQERIDFFAERGYECRVVWEREIQGIVAKCQMKQGA